jgi:hypothetical protein
MTTRSRSEKTGRRAFLKQLAAVGGATATVAVVGNAGAAPDDGQAAPAADKSKGYHETPHVAAYYDKARF